MPKEITHWTLAALLAKELPIDSLFYEPIQAFPNLFFLGAIAPDIPFYHLAGPKTSFIQTLGAPLHGYDARSLVPVLALMDQNPAREPSALAFAAGVICHVLADTSFHPLVYYFSGKEGIHAGATARHRQFETALDLHLSFLYRPEVSLARVVRNLEVPRKRVTGFLASLFQSPREQAGLGAALKFHLILQALFRSSRMYRVFGFLNRKTPWVPDKVTGLIYPCRVSGSLPFFSQKLHYQDPITGALFSTRIQNLMEETILAGKIVLTILSTALVQGGPATGILDDPDLPRIRPDLPQEGFFFWHGKTHLEPDLYRGIDRECLPIKNRRSHDG